MPLRKIEFLCSPQDLGVIAEPQPASKHLPDWFRKLPVVDKTVMAAVDNGRTIKRCMPFMDAMTAGWIIPLAATVRLEISNEGRTVTAGWDFDKELVSGHGPHQVAGHPQSPRPPMKFHNFWTIRTPPGWSCLITPLLNREQPLFEILAGVVDTDRYHAPVNFPFVATAPDGVHVLEKGTPLVQAIPFRRPSAQASARIRAETEAEATARKRIHRNTLSCAGWYRRAVRGLR